MKKGYSIMVGSICLYSASSEAMLVQFFECVYLGLCFFCCKSIKIFQVSGTKCFLL